MGNVRTVHLTWKTKSTVQNQLTGLRITTGMWRVSWLLIFTSVAKDLNSGMPWTNPASGQRPLNCKSSALTTRPRCLLPISMRMLTRDIIAVNTVMLGFTKCVCEWETEKGSVLEAKHQQFYMRAHCSNVATTLTYITKIKVWLKVSPKLLIVAEREGVLDKALPTSVWGAIRMAALFTVICFYFRWLSRSLGSKSLPTDCRHGKR